MPRVLVAGDSMLKDQARSFTLNPGVAVEVRSFSGVRIERLFSMIADSLPGFDAVVVHVGTNNVGDSDITRVAKFRQLVSRIMEKNPEIQVAFSAILPREELCRKEGYGFIDGSRQSWSGLLMLDGVHFNKKGSRVFGRILRGGLHGVVAGHGQEAEDQEWSRHAAEEEHQELRREYGDQAKELAEFWNGKYNFPSLSSSVGGGPACVGEEQVQGMCTVTTTDTCTTSWAAVVQRPPKRVSRGRGGVDGVDNTVRSRGCVPRTQSSQNTEPSRGAPAASGHATREQRLRGVKPSRMPMMLSDGCAPALAGGVWVHRKAGRSVAACGASVRPSSPVAQCIDPHEGVLATACRTTRKQRRRGTKSSGMPMTQTGGRAPALVGGVWVHQKAGTSVAACGASVRPSSPVAQCIDPREGVPATACRTTRKQRRRGTKSSGMPMTQTGGRAPALVGRVWVHQKAGTSVAACGASVRPSSPVAQCIDPCEGVPATACRTTRKQRRRGTKSSGMPMTQRGGCAPALVGGARHSWMAHTCGAAFECSSLLEDSVSSSGRNKGCSSEIVGQMPLRCISCNVPTVHGQAGADAPVSGADRVPCTPFGLGKLAGGGTLGLGVTFSDYSEFESSYKQWLAAKFTPMRIGHSEKNLSSCTSPTSKDPFPYRRITFECCRAGKSRSRGNGIRNKQRYLATGCLCKVSVSLIVEPMPHYKVHSMVEGHNHPEGPGFEMWYPQNRLLNKAEKKEFEDVLSCNVKPKDLKELVFKKTGKHITSQDVRNVKHENVRKIENSLHHGSLLLKQMEDLVKKCPGWIVHIEKDSSNQLLFVLFQSNLMRQFTENYSEVLFFDGTYKVNIEGYILHSVLCEDSTSHGRPICYMFVQRETKEILQAAIAKFLDLNPAVVSNCNVAVMDKDLNEMNILAQLLPNCRILLCSWHVVKYLHQRVSQLCSSRVDKQAVKSLISKLVFSYDDNTYQELLEELENEMQKELESEKQKKSSFLEFYYKNWHDCREMWVHAYRRNIYTFGNNTNNRMESHNQKIKQFMHQRMHLVDAVKALVQYVNHDTLSVSFAQFQETMLCLDTRKIDAFHIQVSTNCTGYASNLIYKEYESYLNGNLAYCMNNGQHTVNSKSNCYIVSQDLTACTCTFQNQFRLPCRHIFAVRSNLSVDLFDVKCVAFRWLKSGFVETDVDTAQAVAQKISLNVSTKGNPKLDTTESKYNYALSELSESCKSIANTLACCGKSELLEKLSEIKSFFNNLITYPRNKTSKTVFNQDEQQDLKQAHCKDEDELNEEGSFGSEDGIVESPASIPSIKREEICNSSTVERTQLKQHFVDHNYCKSLDMNTNSSDIITLSPEPEFHNERKRAEVSHTVVDLTCDEVLDKDVLIVPLNKSPRGRPSKRKRTSKVQALPIMKSGKSSTNCNISDRSMLRLERAARYITQHDLLCVQGIEWLNDNVINEAQSLIHTQFNHVGGLQDVLLGPRLLFKKQDKFVQILHIPDHEHWVTITNYGAPNNSVFLFDSLFEEISNNLVSQVLNIMGLDLHQLIVYVMPTQRQMNTYDCGVYSIANAYCIASGQDPCSQNFDQSSMRGHLLRCLYDGEILHFPITTSRVPRMKRRKICYADRTLLLDTSGHM
ncbi:uncharacterized protein ISCGN_013243 [Ixodes scapularis]